jgi:hypothetical protein
VPPDSLAGDAASGASTSAEGVLFAPLRGADNDVDVDGGIMPENRKQDATRNETEQQRKQREQQEQQRRQERERMQRSEPRRNEDREERDDQRS